MDESGFNPKHRVLGAAVLVLLAVVLLPLILRDEPPEQPAPELSAEVERLPVAASAGVPTTESMPTATPDTALPDAAPAGPSPAVTGPQATAMNNSVIAAPAADTPVTRDAQVTSQWFLQIGAFSSGDNAKREQDRLREKGFVSERVRKGSGRKSRIHLRMGPYASEDEARAQAASILSATGVKPVVQAPKVATAKPATAKPAR